MVLKNKNIGFLDSGIGGIAVLKNAIRLLKNEIFIYFGDSKNLPYGSKTQIEVTKLCVNICDFLIYENNCKAIVLACNTASSAAVNALRQIYEPDIPIIAMEPAIKPAVAYIKNNKLSGRILVLATPFTINGDKFKKLIDFYKNIEINYVALKDLAHMIEEGMHRDEIYEYLYEELAKFYNVFDCVVLGCTHYFFVQDVLKEILGNNIKTFDGIYGTSMELKRRLNIMGMMNEVSLKDRKMVHIYNSLDDSKIARCYDLLDLEEN